MAFHRESQRVSSSEVLQALAEGEEIRLDRCTISGDLDINRLFIKGEDFDTTGLKTRVDDTRRIITFDRPISMTSCTFEGSVFFAPPWDRPGELSVRFEHDAVFNSSRFQSPVRFSGAVFHRLGGFDGCVFGRVCCFRNARFLARGMFRTVTFEGYGLFNGAVFEREAFFNNTCFSKGGNFTRVFFKGRTDFGGAYSHSKSVPVYESVQFGRRRYGDDETFWRFIKQTAQEAGHYQWAGESFYHERCAAFWRKFRGAGYDDLSFGRKLLRRVWGIRLAPEFVLGRLLFGYGERPVRVLVAGLLVILLAGLFYASPWAHVSSDRGDLQQMTFKNGIYLSTTTFMTIGYGDLYPSPHCGLTRTVAMIEGVCGPCMVALFVVSLAKRFSRA